MFLLIPYASQTFTELPPSCLQEWTELNIGYLTTAFFFFNTLYMLGTGPSALYDCRRHDSHGILYGCHSWSSVTQLPQEAPSNNSWRKLRLVICPRLYTVFVSSRIGN